MKISLILSLAVLSLVPLAHAADTTVTMKGVHNCCGGCAKGITAAGTSIKGVTVEADGDVVTIVAKSKSDAKKAVEAIYAAGYYGTTDLPQDAARPAARPDKKMAKATVSSAHMCCGKCVKAATAAVESVAGVTKANIVAKEPTFTVEGNFSRNELAAALNKAGFEGDIK